MMPKYPKPSSPPPDSKQPILAEPGDYILAVWFAANEDVDWMASVVRKPGERAWTLVYRFRYYASGKGNPFDERDKKSWYSAKLDSEEGSSEGEVFSKIALFAAMTAQGINADVVDCIEVRGDSSKLVELMKDKPWVHTKSVPVS